MYPESFTGDKLKVSEDQSPKDPLVVDYKVEVVEGESKEDAINADMGC